MIHQASINDAEAIAALVNSAYRGDSGKKGWTTESDLLDGTRTDKALIASLIRKEDTVVLKYVEGEKLLGCVELRHQEQDMYLGMLTVSPVAQAKGIGKQLVQAAETEARKKRCFKMVMTVISVRTELIQWYERQGYMNTGVRKPFHFDDPRFGVPKQKLEFVVLEKRLSMQ